ncbi:endolytic transglycosylase MltG [Oerskovia flava]|uniref:endolytic transglycosylase MltG n=1 Tax=Oerskovia flava TaxID=2986422 RepID=UPI00223F36AD|nr:endolytic transglycosylase MltG [Oerskovia sp. JB1-3-2]
MTDLFESPPMQQGTPTRQSRSSHRERRAAKRRARRRRRAALVVILTLGLVGAAGYYVLSNAESIFGFRNPAVAASDFDGPGGEPVDVLIEPGSTGTAMGQALVEAGVVASTRAFVDAYEATPGAGGIQSGTHTMLTEMRAADAVALLVANESRVELRLTIPEGYTQDQVIDRAVAVTAFTREQFEEALADPEALGLPDAADGDVEGWLFPATYVLQPDDTAVDIIANMVSQTKDVLDAEGVPEGDRQEVLIKASLIEREAKFAPDRPMMARAIENRLEDGMRLEIDAAVAYGLGIPGTELTRADTEDESNPYNTYRHAGLPPGPIASPGQESIAAVMNPADGTWIFWSAVNLDTGETKFATTFDEHQSNVAELRQWQRENEG